MPRILLQRTGDLPLHFEGETLATATSHRTKGPSNSR